MVTEFGFSDKLGPLRYSENEQEVFLGHSVTQRKNVSEATAKIIDEEIRRIVEGGEARARQILTDHLDELHRLAKGLLEYETLSGEEIQGLFRGEPILRPDREAPVEPQKPRSSVPTSKPAGQREAKGSGGLEPEPQPGA
jgi:cell division protease FtsH